MEFRDLKRQYERLKTDIDIQILDVMNSADFISGSQVTELEQKLAEYAGTKHCISCANGTDAITIALMAYDIGAGDAVFVPDFTFFSSGECPAALGAVPVFVDVKQDTYNIDPKALEHAVKTVLEEGELKPRAVVAVDLFGLPADYNAVRKVCRKYHLLLLEDGAQGFGGQYCGKRACSLGDISTTSFFPAKPLGCYGDGGAVFTNNDEIAQICRSIAVHGKNADDKYDNIRLGMNSRLDTLQAAVLQVKFRAFRDFELEDINRAADFYTEQLNSMEGFILPSVPENCYSSWAQYTVQLPEHTDRTAVCNHMKKWGIPVMIYYPRPMHKQGAFANTRSCVADCPVTEKLCERVLCLPMHPYLERTEISCVCNKLKEALQTENNGTLRSRDRVFAG